MISHDSDAHSSIIHTRWTRSRRPEYFWYQSNVSGSLFHYWKAHALDVTHRMTLSNHSDECGLDDLLRIALIPVWCPPILRHSIWSIKKYNNRPENLNQNVTQRAHGREGHAFQQRIRSTAALDCAYLLDENYMVQGSCLSSKFRLVEASSFELVFQIFEILGTNEHKYVRHRGKKIGIDTVDI